MAPKLYVVWVALLGSVSSIHHKEYVCKGYLAYLFPLGNPSCKVDPDASTDVDTLLIRNGYKPVRLSTTTEDGYILTLCKISKSQGGPSVVLVHTAGTDSGIFTALKKDSLAFTLIESGYTVFLANLRGSRYSREHKNLTTSNQKYWDFSIDDIAKYDVPSILATVNANSDSKDGVYYVGYNLGTVIFLEYASKYPDEAKKRVKMAFIMGSTGKPNFWQRLYGIHSDIFLKHKKFLHLVKYFSDKKYRSFIPNLMEILPLTKIIFFQISTRKYGTNKDLAPSILPFYYNTHFDSIALKVELNRWQYTKYAELHEYREIESFKDIFKRNLAVTPYNLEKISTPIFLFYAKHDTWTHPEPQEHLYKKLSKVAQAGKEEITEKDFGNLAFVYGKSAKKLVYEKLLEIIEEKENQQ